MAAKSAENDPKMAPQDGSKSVKNGVPKMIKILIEKQLAIMRLGGWPGGLRWALGGKTRGVKKANDERKLMFGDFFFKFWLQLALRRPNKDKEMEKRQDR